MRSLQTSSGTEVVDNRSEDGGCHSELEPFDKLRLNAAKAKNLGLQAAKPKFMTLVQSRPVLKHRAQVAKGAEAPWEPGLPGFVR